MRKKTIITISRQCGSGGHELGTLLSRELNIPFYDREIIEQSAKQSGKSVAVYNDYDETGSHSILFSIATGAYTMGTRSNGIASISDLDSPLQEQLFHVESDIIREFAKKGSCVIVGRAAEFVLKDNPDCFSIFVHSSMQSRLRRIEKLHNLSTEKAEKLIQKTDKKRANYYNFYTDKKWGTVENYDLAINSDLGAEKSLNIIKTLIK